MEGKGLNAWVSGASGFYRRWLLLPEAWEAEKDRISRYAFIDHTSYSSYVHHLAISNIQWMIIYGWLLIWIVRGSLTVDTWHAKVTRSTNNGRRTDGQMVHYVPVATVYGFSCLKIGLTFVATGAVDNFIQLPPFVIRLLAWLSLSMVCVISSSTSSNMFQVDGLESYDNKRTISLLLNGRFHYASWNCLLDDVRQPAPVGAIQ